MGWLRDHRGPLRADFRRFYGLDLDPALTAYTPGVLADLAAYLPPEAALWAVLDPETAAWSSRIMLAHLTAMVVDSLRDEPLPRPWDTVDDGSAVDDWGLTGDVMTMDEARDFFGF